MELSGIINKAKKYAMNEIKIYGALKIEWLELSSYKWQILAEKLWANKEIVMLWTILMDLKLGECFKEGKINEHVQRSSQSAQEFLKQYDIDKDILNKIISCIESHHGVNKYFCKEAEICANADCYRFLHPRGFLAAFVSWAETEQNLKNILDQIEDKLDEKYKILSLEICKEELKWYYQQFKKLIKEAREQN